MAAFAVVVLRSAAYVTAYVQLGTYHDWRAFTSDGPTNRVTRHYADKEWCLTLLAPAAAVESKWLGCPVYLTFKRESPGWYAGTSLSRRRCDELSRPYTRIDRQPWREGTAG